MESRGGLQVRTHLVCTVYTYCRASMSALGKRVLKRDAVQRLSAGNMFAEPVCEQASLHAGAGAFWCR